MAVFSSPSASGRRGGVGYYFELLGMKNGTQIEMLLLKSRWEDTMYFFALSIVNLKKKLIWNKLLPDFQNLVIKVDRMVVV